LPIEINPLVIFEESYKVVVTTWKRCRPSKTVYTDALRSYKIGLEKAREIMVQEALKHPKVPKTVDLILQVLDFSEGAIVLRMLFLPKD
jgi:hypothetical protein